MATFVTNSSHYLVLLTALSLPFSCSRNEVLSAFPANGSLSHGEVVLVENDGRCPPGYLIKVTGGKRSADIPRLYDCAMDFRQ